MEWIQSSGASTAPTGDLPAGAGAVVDPGGALPIFVGGKWRASEVEGVQEDRSPADGQLLALVPLCGPQDVDSAVTAARAAQAGWSETPVLERARAVGALCDLLVPRKKVIASRWP